MARTRVPPPPVAKPVTSECKYMSLHVQVDALVNAMNVLERVEHAEEVTSPPQRLVDARAILERRVHDAAENLKNWSAQEL